MNTPAPKGERLTDYLPRLNALLSHLALSPKDVCELADLANMAAQEVSRLRSLSPASADAAGLLFPKAVPEDVKAWMKACEDGKWGFQEAWEQLQICLAPAAALQSAAPKGWVRVEDGLPKRDDGSELEGEVLVAWSGGNVEQMHYTAVECYLVKMLDDSDVITHWMPLPAAPAKHDEEGRGEG